VTLLQAIVLGLVQGLTEFFPVSSSAHLRLAKWLLNVSDGEHLLYFDLICHVGTLLALMFFLRRQIWSVLSSAKKMFLYTLALIPLVPAYFLLKPLRLAASDPAYLGYFLLFTSLLLFLASSKKPSQMPLGKWKSVLCIGVMQTMALIPGISRSGSTISAARFCGWQWREAAEFSFLLSIPAILGGQVLESIKLLGGHAETASIGWECYAGGFASSFGLGLITVRFVFWIYEKEKVRPFAWYCLGAAFVAWVTFATPVGK
jgi:undecaprenyl-diphosphatase